MFILNKSHVCWRLDTAIQCRMFIGDWTRQSAYIDNDDEVEDACRMICLLSVDNFVVSDHHFTVMKNLEQENIWFGLEFPGKTMTAFLLS